MAGLSIGAQIITEVLSQKSDITDYAIIESALVYPIKGINAMTVPVYQLFYGLVQKRWFAKIQAKSLFVPNDLFDMYYKDSIKMSKQSLINMTISNGNYKMKDSISKTTARVLIIVGSKEIGIMKKSAKLLHNTIMNSELYISNAMKHGEISLVYPEKYVELIKNFK